jgi:hypothetical protein
MQLTAALNIERHTAETLRFACFDMRLRKSARALGMESLPADCLGQARAAPQRRVLERPLTSAARRDAE